MEGRATARPPNPALPYREDCWSEGETEALVEAWGDRFLDLNRGNLRQKHWQEVADAVNSRRGSSSSRRPPRTDVQCKNRIDTLKKKYKIEKARIADAGGGGSSAGSQWQFYDRLDVLIGSSTPAAASSAVAKKPSPSLPLAIPLPYHKKGSPLPVASAAPAFARPVEKKPLLGESLFRRAAAAAAAAKQDDGEDDDEESGSSSRSVSPPPPPPPPPRPGKKRRDSRGGGGGDGDVEGIRDLARAIERFAEVYERVEAAKQRQVMELEKQKMELAKELEFQRMQIFVDSQVQLEKIKRAKHADADYL